MTSDSEWRLLQADKFAAERQRDIAVQSSQSWRREAKRLEAQVERLTKERDEARQTLSDWTTDIGVRGFARRSELDALRAQIDRLLAKEAARIAQELTTTARE